MLPDIRTGFDFLAAAVETTRLGEHDTLTVNAPPSFASRWLVPRLSLFAAAHPEVELRLSSSADTVDRRGATAVFEEELIDPRIAASEIAIRYGTGNYPGYRVDRIFAPDFVTVCSPRLPTPERPLATPADLRQHTLIHDETIADEMQQGNWAAWLKAAGVADIDAQRGPRFSNSVLAVDAALDGQGVALALRPLVETDIATGRLMLPFDLALASPYAYFLVMPEGVARRPSVTAFRLWLLQEGCNPA
jgi:LysR family glycine cleavage system transcriptional activator